ncbi:MAG TPA: TIM44-like domain-containing protein, partial [Azospirillum sp.]
GAAGFERQGAPPAGGQTGVMGGGMGAGLGGLAGGLGGGLGRGAAAPRARGERSDEIGIGPSDYQEFEGLLVGVQDAYGREDVDTLRRMTTPEMATYFADDLADNARRGVVNKVSGAQLLQGDLAEAWRESDAEYATVAMRFSLTDVTVERATGRVVEGDANRPTEAAELWTFRRTPGGRWQLSAIQQTA